MASSWAGNTGYRSSEPPSAQESSSKKKPQPRQLLSCTTCRERKVKCDRTKPCSACCARGHPKECQFIVGEGNDYSPIVQSYEIKKLRLENQKLKERLRDARMFKSEDEHEDEDSSDRAGPKAPSRAAAAKQRRFRTSDRTDNLYFGTPGLASIVSDFANLHVSGNHSLTHTIPRGRDMYPPQGSRYPFPCIWTGDNSTSALLKLLPERQELFDCLDLFSKRAQSCSFPHMPDQVTKKEVSRFLDEIENNPSVAENHSDMLALILATLATGTQMGVHDSKGGQWVEGAMETSHARSECYLVACMQALRNASFMSRPTLLGVQTLIMIGPYLTNSGRFLDAWTLFGTTIRLAHSIGLHRNPKYLDPVPPLRECTIRQTLWWWMLHMDQQYSVTLGRPLGISGLGDCPPPEPLTTNQTVLRLGEFVDHFTILARQILSSDGMMSVGRIDEFTDKLMGLWDTMPESLQFNESWSRSETDLPEWPLDVMSATLFAKVQSFIILLNRQRVEQTQHSASVSPPTHSAYLSGQNSTTYTPSSSSGDALLHAAPIRGRALVINSSVHLLQTFLFFRHRNPAVLVCWTLGQQAFNAAMILILDAWETHNEQDLHFVNQAYALFDELQRNGVHKLAELAVKRISDGLAQLGQRRQERERQAAAAAAEAQAMSRRNSQQQQQAYPLHHPTLTIPTTPLLDLSGDTVMGNASHGMFLLEDANPQSYIPQPFAPFNFALPAAAEGTHLSSPTTAQPTNGFLQQAELAPVSNVTIAPFPVMSPPFVPPVGTYNVGLQPRMVAQSHGQQQQQVQNGFGAATEEVYQQQQQQYMPQHRHQHQHQRTGRQQQQQGSGPGFVAYGGPGGVVGSGPNHRLDRPPRAQARRHQQR